MIYETDRLRLRPLRKDDLEQFVAIANDKDVARMLSESFPHPYTMADAIKRQEKIQQRHDAGNPISFAIARKQDDLVIGNGGFDGGTVLGDAIPPIGYWFGKNYWGHGYATEATRAFITIGFTLYGYNEIAAEAACDNPASVKVLERAGMIIDTNYQRGEPNQRNTIDYVLFRLTRNQWKITT